MKKTAILTIVCLSLIGWQAQQSLWAQATEIQYLSGTGFGDTKTWDFYCSAGMKSGKWSKIEVPSQWELQGYGEYTYGRYYLNKEAKPSDENGTYRYRFNVPSNWKGKRVSIVFEGVMTDTEVKINGKSAGGIHQGGFYKFSYDISDKLKFGSRNQLEVKVWKQSANASINSAERKADWWLFGGIYRPVYLTAVPETHIERIAVDAKADGSLTMNFHTQALSENYSLRQTITLVGDDETTASQTVSLQKADEQKLTTRWENIKTWDCEHPNLYTLKLELLNANNQVVHVFTERIGFRTVEFRPRDGFYVNGTKIVVKGVNRHVFYPDGGRTVNKALSVRDAELIKAMNMNAVRTHYPPDDDFLDACDSLGLFFMEELAGWQNCYDTQVGTKLLREMIQADVNHPCIFVWSNGNEGGWNTAIDPLFAELDIQKRHVVHPWADFNGVDTHHYPAYQTGPGRLAGGYKVFMPTEFLHAQYDKGAGAGLQDFWASYKENPLFAGGFIWCYSDEAVKRTDKNGILDSDGPNGPDGIVGPYREKEGSYYTIREVWSPIQFSPLRITESFKGEFTVGNDFLFSNLDECSMVYRLRSIPSPLKSGEPAVLAEGKVALPSISPGEWGKAKMNLPDNFFAADVLELEAFDSKGRTICVWSWSIKYADKYFAEQRTTPKSAKTADIVKSGEFVTLSAAGISAKFSNTDGTLLEVKNGDKSISFKNGPLPIGMKADFVSADSYTDGNDAVFVARYIGAWDSVVWRMTADGMLGMDVLMLNRRNGGGYKGAFFDTNPSSFGLTFSLSEEEVSGMKWFGKGPYRVWKNRLQGANYNLWQKDYNNTITGESFESLVYPEFKGYHANLYWASIESESSPFTVYSETDGVYLRLFTPEEPLMRRDGKNVMEAFCEGDISFLLDIPAIQSYKPLSQQGPHSQKSHVRMNVGDQGLHIKLWYDFR